MSTFALTPPTARFSSVKAAQGRIDVLFANAGLGDMQPLGAITEASFDLIFGVNVKGTLFTVQKALPLMKAGGSIILTGSTTGSSPTARIRRWPGTQKWDIASLMVS